MEEAVNHSISFHFIPPIQKKITFFFIAFISWNLLNEMEGIKKYYNSKLIEQLADNIKTKFIWFLWRKQSSINAAQQTTHQINPIFSS